MVADGRAKLLVSYGYNMYGKRMKDGRNFFDKPFNEEYEMFDWVPKSYCSFSFVPNSFQQRRSTTHLFVTVTRE
eukprot:scaffold19953_cov37-Cyclotella_meneghiniana.AAC.2